MTPRPAPGPGARPPVRPAVVRPGHDGRPHPDPRADPPTRALPTAGGSSAHAGTTTVRLPVVATATERLPVVPDVTGPAPDAADTGAADAPAVPAAPAAGDRAGLHDGLALSLSSVLGSLAGFVSWLIAARIMPAAEVGDASLVVSAFILVAGAAQLNLGVGLMRWLPAAGRSTGRLVWSALLLIMPLSGLVGLVYALLAPRLATISAGEGPVALGLLVFVLACAGWGVFVVHDFILVAVGKPWWAVWRNGVFAVVRIGLLVVLGGVAGLGSYGVVLSWVGPIVVWIALGSVVIALLTRRISARATGGALPARRAALAFLAPTAVAQFGGALLYNQVPVVVNLRFGPEPGAVFFIAWQAVTVVDIAAVFFMNSVVVGVAREPGRLAELSASSRKRLLVLFLPALALGAALAHPLLLVFGEEYARADHVLQLLLLGLAFRLVVVHELGVRQAVGEAMAYARLQLISTLLVLAVAIVTPVAGAGVDALVPLAVGYAVVQVACVIAVVLSPARRRAAPEVPS